jgi:hypothetical protein
MNSDSPEVVKKTCGDIQDAIDYEKTKWQRSTIIKMLEMKLFL